MHAMGLPSSIVFIQLVLHDNFTLSFVCIPISQHWFSDISLIFLSAPKLFCFCFCLSRYDPSVRLVQFPKPRTPSDLGHIRIPNLSYPSDHVAIVQDFDLFSTKRLQQKRVDGHDIAGTSVSSRDSEVGVGGGVGSVGLAGHT